MKNRFLLLNILICIGCLTVKSEAIEKQAPGTPESFLQIRTLFQNPPAEYRSAPLWVWNDRVTREEIDRQLLELKSGGMGGVFIHPRPGLITPYLSDEWFSLVRYTVEQGKKLGMKVWLYDENSYPSGFAGGNVPAKMPESYNQGQGLLLRQVQTLPEDAFRKYFLILKKVGSKFEIIQDAQADSSKQAGDYYLLEKTFYHKTPWNGGFSYVDLLHKGVTEKFLEVTMTGYEKAIGREFGKTVPGIFTDEPNIRPPEGIRWTPELFTAFKKRWQYDLKPYLPSLFLETGDWRSVRHNYYELLLEMFIDRWGKPYHDYCEQHHLKLTGHYWEHAWPDPSGVPDNMAMYAWHQMPAIDLLMNRYSEDVHAQFGNVRSVKELRSVANQMGRRRTLSETYGAGGWDLSFADMKRIGEWEFVLGINFLNQHLSYITIKGARKRDHPQSFSYHEPWWQYYHLLGDYFGRLSLALSSGEQINRILILEPTTTAWMYYSPAESNPQFTALGDSFQNLLSTLEKYQVEYDLGSENIMRDHGKVGEKELVIGERSYRLVILPPALQNLNSATVNLLDRYLRAGGKLLSLTGIPRFIDGKESGKVRVLAKKYSKQWVSAQSVTEAGVLPLLSSDQITFRKPEKIGGKLFHQRRELADGSLLFLVNTSTGEWASGTLSSRGKSVTELNLRDGSFRPYPIKNEGEQPEIAFDLPPVGSLLLYFSDSTSSFAKEAPLPAIRILNPVEKMKVTRTAPNVLPLDYCDLTLDDQTENDLYFFQAAKKVFRHFGFEGDPWSQAVQFKRTIIDCNHFPANSEFSASYSFEISGGVNTSGFQAIIEQSDLWQVSVNGTAVHARAGKHWLDRQFGVFRIGDQLGTGKNTVTLQASPMTVYSELEPIYILGDFGLQPQEKGWKIVREKPLVQGSWKDQELPFYSDGVSYSQNYRLKPDGKRVVVKLTDWKGSVAAVQVNQKPAGVIAWPPYELDVTDHIQSGENEIAVIVYGTLKNLLGPHHIGPVRGSAWPASFQSAPTHQPPGTAYDLIGYGLFRDFTVIEAEGPVRRVYWRDYQVVKPLIIAPDSLIVDSGVTIKLDTKTDNADIYYTLDGSTPDATSLHYSRPIHLNKSAILKATAQKQGMLDSKTAQRTFTIVDSKKNGLNYRYFEGNWERLPDFKVLTTLKKGRVFSFNLDRMERRSERFAVIFSGYLKVENPGNYIFYLDSNDGSKLKINDMVVVDHDGSHGSQVKQGQVALENGLVAIEVQYFDAGGSQNLQVFYSGPGVRRQIIPADKLFLRK